MQNPTFRYLHQVMSKMIFGRGESDGVVRKIELYSLWAMLNKVDFDSGFHFLQTLWRAAKASSGMIVFGGLITQVAFNLGCALDGLEVIHGNDKIDIDSCLAMKMICQDENGFAFPRNNGFPLPLPCPERTSVHDPVNWVITDLHLETVPSIIEETEYHQECSSSRFLQPSRHPEPPRHSFTYGTGPSRFDFSNFRASLDSLHEK